MGGKGGTCDAKLRIWEEEKGVEEGIFPVQHLDNIIIQEWKKEKVWNFFPYLSPSNLIPPPHTPPKKQHDNPLF